MTQMIRLPTMASPMNGPGRKKRKRERLDKAARIAIIGSGLGGLGVAISLEQAGFTNICIYERDSSVSSRREGYGLTISYNPKGPLAQMELLDQVADCDCPSRSHYVFETNGSIRGYYGNAFSAAPAKGQRGNLRLPRQQLRRLMLAKVQAPIKFNKRLVSFEMNETGKQLTLSFDDETSEEAVDLLVGADGIRSSVVKGLITNDDGLNYLGIFILLGIADFSHPLLDERGFYTLDGNHRLFTMPYEGSRVDGDNNKRRIMWQLSFRLESYDEARELSDACSKTLQSEVLKRCKGWHEPVEAMVQSTPLETIWGTGLMDRDPRELVKQLNNTRRAAVVVVGDAVHAMSPFKGAGANQALLDGPLLASWLQRASLDSALKGFFREMGDRTHPRVLASREAARYLHSPQVMLDDQDFAGVKKSEMNVLLQKLREGNVGANNSGAKLDDQIQQIIDDAGLQEPCQSRSKQELNPEAEATALSLASKGNTNGLRMLSLRHSPSIRAARNSAGESCLHLAVQSEHYGASRWLLTEAFLSCNLASGSGITPLQMALASNETRVRQLFEAISKQS